MQLIQVSSRKVVAALKRAFDEDDDSTAVSLLGLCVFGDGLGALTDGVLGELTRQQQTHSSLDFAAGDGRATVVVGQTRGFSCNALEDVVDEGVHDAHGFAADASVGMHLLQNFVDVDGVTLPPPPSLLLVGGTGGLCLAGGLLSSFRCGFGWHVDVSNKQNVGWQTRG